MTWIIILIVVILLLVLLRWTWHNLGSIENSAKCTYIVGGLVIVYIITFIIYNISKIGITYENKETMKLIQTVFVSLFTIVNSYVILPYSIKKIEQINSGKAKKEKIKKSIIILLVIIIIVGVFESLYLGSVQQGILSIINK